MSAPVTAKWTQDDILKLVARAEKAEAERDRYKAVLENLLRGYVGWDNPDSAAVYARRALEGK